MQDIEQMLEMINAHQDMRREMEVQWSGAFSRADEMKREAEQEMERIQNIKQRLESISVPFSPPPAAPAPPAKAAPASGEPSAGAPGQATAAAVQPAHKFCRNCGSKLPIGAAFCGDCGAKLS